MVLPQRLVAPVVAAKGEREPFSSATEQLTLADFVESGAYDRQVRRMRQRHRRRRDQLVAALHARAPHVRVTDRGRAARGAGTAARHRAVGGPGCGLAGARGGGPQGDYLHPGAEHASRGCASGPIVPVPPVTPMPYVPPVPPTPPSSPTVTGSSSGTRLPPNPPTRRRSTPCAAPCRRPPHLPPRLPLRRVCSSAAASSSVRWRPKRASQACGTPCVPLRPGRPPRPGTPSPRPPSPGPTPCPARHATPSRRPPRPAGAQPERHRAGRAGGVAQDQMRRVGRSGSGRQVLDVAQDRDQHGERVRADVPQAALLAPPRESAYSLLSEPAA